MLAREKNGSYGIFSLSVKPFSIAKLTSMSDACFRFSVGDYLGDTMHLSCLEHGAYDLLMFSYYTTGKPLPDNDAVLCRICKLPMADWKAIRSAVAQFFRVKDGRWFHKRIDLELAKSKPDVPPQSRNHSIPTLQQVIEKARMTAIPESTATDFYNHFESTGWNDKNGHPIASWPHKLATWWQREQSNRAEKQHHTNGFHSAPKSKSIVEQDVEAIARQVNRKYANY